MSSLDKTEIDTESRPITVRDSVSVRIKLPELL